MGSADLDLEKTEEEVNYAENINDFPLGGVSFVSLLWANLTKENANIFIVFVQLNVLLEISHDLALELGDLSKIKCSVFFIEDLVENIL